FVYAISRAVKRQLFEWAAREGTVHGPVKEEETHVAIQVADSDFMERHALLRHFLYRCVANGHVADAELDLLIQIKLDGNTGDQIAEWNSITSNAVRQRMKRLLAKLRRLAGNDRIRSREGSSRRTRRDQRVLTTVERSAVAFKGRPTTPSQYWNLGSE